MGAIPPAPRIAIVGTRSPDCAGIETARMLARCAVLHGFCVVSGGAAGIDTAAHEAAMEAGGVTLAVLGSAPDDLYPSSNVALFERISSDGGGLITEIEPGRPCVPYFFLRRNRLLALLGHRVVVVQARHRSGALNTASWARRFSIPLYAVPGSPLGRLSDGPNRLIARGEATALIDVNQPFEGSLDTGSDRRDDSAVTSPHDAGVDGNDSEDHRDAGTGIVLSLLGPEPCLPEQVACRSGLTVTAVMRALTLLELGGRARCEGTAGYSRTPGYAPSSARRRKVQIDLPSRNLKSP